MWTASAACLILAMVAPVTPLTVVRPFVSPLDTWSAGHRGADLVVRRGQPVRAPAAGEVAFADPVAGRPVLTIRHPGFRTTYEPVVSTLRPGTHVSAGDRIGRIGRGGHCDRVCLHWGLRRGPGYADPMLLLRAPLPVLKPIRPQGRPPGTAGTR